MTSSGSARASTGPRRVGSQRQARPQSAVMERGTGTMRPGRLAALPLMLGASTVPGQYMLPALMAAFCRKHPQYRCELRHGDSAQIHRLLQNGQIRMGFVGSRMDTTGMAYHPLLRDELVMVTPNTPHYQAAHRRGARGLDLLGEPTIA